MAKSITLVLSMEQARTLLQVVEHVGGDLRTSRRKHTEEIAELLTEKKVKASLSLADGSIYFADHTIPKREAGNQ